MSNRKKSLFTALMLVFLSVYGAPKIFAQEYREADAIKCWWKADRSAIRVGEKFAIILTCQVVETQSERAVPNESSLEPAAVSFTPYSSVGGVKYPDIRKGDLRFFQYQYDLKLMGQDFFGKEVPIPPLEVHYRIDRKVQKESINTKERVYRLPELPMRVHSLVPKDTRDIRDSFNGTFGNVKEFRFRASVGFALAGLLLALPLLVLSLPLWRAVRKRNKNSPNGTFFENAILLRRMLVELKYVRNAVGATGWNPELVSKVVTVCRIAGAMALSRNISQLSAAFETRGLEGQLKLRKGWFWPKKVMICSSLTPEMMKENISASPGDSWNEEFLAAFNVFNCARYSFNELDNAQLNKSLAQCTVLIRKLHYRHLWLVRKSFVAWARLKEWRPRWLRTRS